MSRSRERRKKDRNKKHFNSSKSKKFFKKLHARCQNATIFCDDFINKKKRRPDMRPNDHHLRPRSRFGCDERWNKFPWFIDPHLAFHDLFGNDTLKEIWEIKLDEIYVEVVMYNVNDYLKFVNCSNVKKNEELRTRFLDLYNRKRNAWPRAFGDGTKESAKKILRKMMWWNVFVELKPHQITEEILRKKIREIKDNPDRKWAFQTLFDCDVDSLPNNILETINNYEV